MRAALAVAALVVGFTVAACGSNNDKAVAGLVAVSGTTTISHVRVGTLLRCKGGPTARVPHWFGGSALTLPGVRGQIALVHRRNGSVTVSCTK